MYLSNNNIAYYKCSIYCPSLTVNVKGENKILCYSGMQASSSGLVQADEGPSRKRPTPADSQKKAKKKCFW